MKFININEVNDALKMEVREWRNNENIRKYMYTDHVISLEEHKNWLTKIENSLTDEFFVVNLNGESIGVVLATEIDYKNKKCDWGFYLKPNLEKGVGLGSKIEYNFLNYVFEKLGMEKLNGEVLETNPAVVRLHQKFGFIQEGVKRKEILKDGKRLDIILVGITKDEWLEKREKLNEKYKFN